MREKLADKLESYLSNNLNEEDKKLLSDEKNLFS